ncbi:hypothetical protein GOBAR_AA20011 [Gossypium barbadense]|uniref:Protein NEOXANTHIN-DEFICIENT 1 n=1 Tax=Gossypium barbadense TaxID=3634 RepID=A0A2P5XBD8_GOSBA|nr:hypothetical protein GOBAR_AA20011 [Gossypium barbadense]
MGLGETKSSPGYGNPPWIFKGSALYQLHLVKAETVRAFIPKELRLVEAFGYTLGGFFLANYDDSPAGVFDELVVIAGIVWNPPTSCAWAARVLVNSEEACHHGRKLTFTPAIPMVQHRDAELLLHRDQGALLKASKSSSQIFKGSPHSARLTRITPVPRQTKDKFGGFLNMIGVGTTICHSKDCMDVQVTEVVGPASSDICNIKLLTDGEFIVDPTYEMHHKLSEFAGLKPLQVRSGLFCLGIHVPVSSPTPKFNKWMGPSITLSLPSFSGQTEYNPNLLKYSCRLACVRAVRPAKVSGPSPLKKERSHDSESRGFTAEEVVDNARNLSISVMLSKPILALEFNFLEMQVEAPIILSNNTPPAQSTHTKTCSFLFLVFNINIS